MTHNLTAKHLEAARDYGRTDARNGVPAEQTRPTVLLTSITGHAWTYYADGALIELHDAYTAAYDATEAARDEQTEAEAELVAEAVDSRPVETPAPAGPATTERTELLAIFLHVLSYGGVNLVPLAWADAEDETRENYRADATEIMAAYPHLSPLHDRRDIVTGVAEIASFAPGEPVEDSSVALRRRTREDVTALTADDPTEMLAIWYEIAAALPSAPFPVLIVEPVTDDGETFMGARCPYCHGLLGDDGITVIDWAAEGTESDDVNADEEYHSMSYDHEPEMETLHYETSCCSRPVSLPDGWTEQN